MTSTVLPAFSPVDASQRLDVLDVLRGFALIGICVANAEFFNRPVVESGQGIPAGLHGLDLVVAWLVAFFVSTKFWTLFALLFGMGFALMQGRAQAAGRPFLPVYARRVGVLFVIGLLHHSLLWSGDILISYAVGAMALMLTLFAPVWLLVAAFIACLALPAVPGLGFVAWLLAPIVLASLAALYLRAGKRWLFPLVSLGTGIPILVAAMVAAFNDDVSGTMLMGMSGSLLVSIGVIACFNHAQVMRPLVIGAQIVMLAYVLIALEAGARHFVPGFAPWGGDAAASASGQQASTDVARELRYREQLARSAEETEVLTTGSHADAVAMRVAQLDERLRDEAGFAIVLVGVFLVGYWFVQSGVMARAGAHLSLFRRLAWVGTPLGIGLGLLGGLVSTGRPAGIDDRGYDFANALLMLGSLPAALGYMGIVVLMLYSRGAPARIRVLAPFGQMALSNYLMQSVVFALLFYAHGLGLWGIGRTQQVGIALLLCLLQIGLSHWWMARFRYGPVEWVWRALTYLSWPAMRRQVR